MVRINRFTVRINRFMVRIPAVAGRGSWFWNWQSRTTNASPHVNLHSGLAGLWPAWDAGRGEEFSEGTKIFKPCPTHFSGGGGAKFSGGAYKRPRVTGQRTSNKQVKSQQFPGIHPTAFSRGEFNAHNVLSGPKRATEINPNKEKVWREQKMRTAQSPERPTWRNLGHSLKAS